MCENQENNTTKTTENENLNEESTNDEGVYKGTMTYLFPKYQVIYVDYSTGKQEQIIFATLPQVVKWINTNLIFNSSISVCQITKIYTIDND